MLRSLWLMTLLGACAAPEPPQESTVKGFLECEDLQEVVKQVLQAPPATRAETLAASFEQQCRGSQTLQGPILQRWLDPTKPRPHELAAWCQSDPDVLDELPGLPRETTLRYAAAACDLLTTDLFNSQRLLSVSDVESAAYGHALYAALRRDPRVLPHVARDIASWFAGMPNDAGVRVDRGTWGELQPYIQGSSLMSMSEGAPVTQACAVIWWFRDDTLSSTERPSDCPTDSKHLLVLDKLTPARVVLEQFSSMDSGPVYVVAEASQRTSAPQSRQAVYETRMRFKPPTSGDTTVVITSTDIVFGGPLPGVELPSASHRDLARHLQNTSHVALSSTSSVPWFRVLEVMQDLQAASPQITISLFATPAEPADTSSVSAPGSRTTSAD